MGSQLENEASDFNAKNLSWWKKFIPYRRSKWFDPTKSFVELPCFKVPLISVICIFVVMYLTIVAFSWSNISLCGTADCFNKWFDLFKVPIATLAVLIPLLGLSNANHKSEQAKLAAEQAKQAMELSKSQNNFANYYKHLEEFCKYAKSIKFPKELGAPNFRKLHWSLYPSLKSEGNSSLDKERISEFYQSIVTYLFIFEEPFSMQDGRSSPDELMSLAIVLTDEFLLTRFHERAEFRDCHFYVVAIFDLINKLFKFDSHFHDRKMDEFLGSLINISSGLKNHTYSTSSLHKLIRESLRRSGLKINELNDKACYSRRFSELKKSRELECDRK